MCKLLLVPIFLSLLNSLVFQEKLPIFVLMAGEKCSKLVLHVDLKIIILFSIAAQLNRKHFPCKHYRR